MFRGVHHLNMDSAGRIAIPMRLREALSAYESDHVVITIDAQYPCLVVYPLSIWEEIEISLQNLPGLNSAAKRFQRLIQGYAEDRELDANKRLLLPLSLREYAHLEKNLIIVGLGKKLEIWADKLWKLERGEALEEIRTCTDFPEELLSLDV